MPTYVIKRPEGSTLFIKGRLGPHCRHCTAPGDSYLCDFPVGDDKTCDAALCDQCASEIAPDLHYCKPHNAMWQKFQDSGGVERTLGNVIPFRMAGK